MKQLLTAILILICSNLFAQSATTTLDGTNSGVTGGDGTGKIVSYQWTVQGTPPAPVTFATPAIAKTDATFTKAGTYTILLTVKDNLGNVATATVTVIAYDQQIPHANVSASQIEVYLK